MAQNATGHQRIRDAVGKMRKFFQDKQFLADRQNALFFQIKKTVQALQPARFFALKG